MDNTEAKKPPSTEIDVFYQKASDHRSVHVDGAWAAITAQMDIQLAFFAELQPLPRRIRHKVVDGKLGSEINKDSDVGLVREAQVTVLLNPITATQVIKLLERMVKNLRERMPEEVRQALDNAIEESLKDVSSV